MKETQKIKGVVVSIKLDKSVVAALKEVESGEFYFWSGNGEVKSCVGNYQRALTTLFKKAGIKAYAHLFRHTVASELLALEPPVPLINIARILGHKSTRTTELVYGHWIKARQEKLDSAV